MFTSFLKGLFTFLFAFSLGASFGGQEKTTADSELQQKVQDHMDVIVDESAAIVDDVMEEARKNEHVKEAEDFVNDVTEIVNNTKEDIHAHFGSEEESESEVESEVETEAVKAVEEETAAEAVEEVQTEKVTEAGN